MFKPKDNEFFDLFEESSNLVKKGSDILASLINDPDSIKEKMQEIVIVEKECDVVTAAVIDKINKTFITPIDREDIYNLIQELDSIVDVMEGAVERMLLYKAGRPTEDCIKLIQNLIDGVNEIHNLIPYLRNIKKNQKALMEGCEKINKLESVGDKLYRASVGTLFPEETDSITIIKWKEIYEYLENAMDKCEDVSDLLKGVVLKYA
jgi:uncharacterized protein